MTAGFGSLANDSLFITSSGGASPIRGNSLVNTRDTDPGGSLNYPRKAVDIELMEAAHNATLAVEEADYVQAERDSARYVVHYREHAQPNQLNPTAHWQSF